MSILNNIKELYDKTLIVCQQVKSYEDSLETKYQEYIDNFPSEILFTRLTAKFPHDIFLWTKFAKFTSKDQG